MPSVNYTSCEKITFFLLFSFIMASDEHKRLADFIKSTHNQLRQESRLYGPREAWQRHLARTEVLKNYARTMQKLATNHWDQQMLEKDGGINCRNKWIRSQCYEYFFNGGMNKFDEREKEIRKKIFDAGRGVDNSTKQITSQAVVNNECAESSVPKIKLLDVGSCYNPLAAEERFHVIAIDLAPFMDKVLQCDFLNIQIGLETIISSDNKSIEQLKESSFDVVVFSLLLEYLPCPEQRFACCQKAYKLLKDGRILLIITPDSNHVGANADIMKSWRYVLSRLGFMRIVYEKMPHLHCLGYRKCVDKAVAVRWSEIQVIPENDRLLSAENKIYIPQDFPTTAVPKESRENVVYDADELASVFDEMPCCSDVSE